MTAPSYLFATSPAATHCRIAHTVTASGAINASNISLARRKVTSNRGSSGDGMFGWMAIQMHEKINAAQLHMMSKVVRKPVSVHEVAALGLLWSMMGAACAP